MTTMSPACPRIERHALAVLRPRLEIRPASGAVLAAARPLAAITGRAEFEVVAYSDGGDRHAPEVVAALRAALGSAPAGTMLVYAHRGQKAEAMMPLLPSLLFTLGHRGSATAVRLPDGAGEADAARHAERFAAGQLAPGAGAVLTVDHQERIGAPGTLGAAPVAISLIRRAAEGAPHLELEGRAA